MIHSAQQEQSQFEKWQNICGCGVSFFFLSIFSRGILCLLTVSGQAELFTSSDILFHPDNIDLLGEKSNFTCVTGSLLEGDGHVWIILSCYLTNPEWHPLRLSSQLLKTASLCCYILSLLCSSSSSFETSLCTSFFQASHKIFHHPKYKKEIRCLDCFNRDLKYPLQPLSWVV